jgi:hypothetical protein
LVGHFLVVVDFVVGFSSMGSGEMRCMGFDGGMKVGRIRLLGGREGAFIHI